MTNNDDKPDLAEAWEQFAEKWQQIAESFKAQFLHLAELYSTTYADDAEEEVDLKRLYATTDARVWAEEFAKVCPEVDQHLMLGWFANAMGTAEILYAKRPSLDTPPLIAFNDTYYVPADALNATLDTLEALLIKAEGMWNAPMVNDVPQDVLALLDARRAER